MAHRRRRSDGDWKRTTASTMGPLFALVDPSVRHLERQRQEETMRRDDEDSGEPPLGIDLDAGTAVFRMPRKPRDGQSTE
jgi:hypothetical protein